jgi:uncharacterized membrane protein YbhN (UPF0104 family)
VNSLQSFWHATGVFTDRLADVRIDALLIALAFGLSNLLLRSTAWRNILAAAHPGVRVRWRSITGAYLAGAGVNAVVPARGGDVTKIYLAHRSIPGSAYTTVTSSLIAETLIDIVIGPILLITAYSTGKLPHVPTIGHLPAFEWSFMAAHARVFILAVATILIVAGLFFTYIERHVNSFWSRIADGVAILRTPKRYATQVLSFQLVGWCCRALAMYWFLKAFGIPASFPDAVLALSAASAATLLPLTPGGIGPQQALLGYMFRGAAPASAVLSFSVGMQFSITLLNLLVGGIALSLMLRKMPWNARLPKPPEKRAPAAS